MRSGVVFGFVTALLLLCAGWSSMLYCQEEVVPRIPYTLTPDVRFSPAVKTYNFTENHHGIIDGLYYVDFDLVVPKDGKYEVSTFSANVTSDDTDTVIRYYGTGGYSCNYRYDFSKIEFDALKGERHYFRVLPIDESQNTSDFSICYECKKITEPKKFIIGMYTHDYDIENEVYVSDLDYFTKEEFEKYNVISVGNDDRYLQYLSDYNFNCILPHHQLKKPEFQTVDSNSTDRPDRSFLDRALSHGLDVIIVAPGIDLGVSSTSFDYDPEAAVETIKYFDGHPAISSYHIYDEPHYHPTVDPYLFDDIDSVRIDLNKYSSKSSYVSIYPLYATKDQFYTGSVVPSEYFTAQEFIDEWLNPYIRICNPAQLTFGYYLFPIGNDVKVKTEFIHNYQIISKVASENNIDFIATLTPWKDWTFSLTANSMKEYNYQVYTALFHGVKGFLYWARETNTNTYNKYLGHNSWDLRTSESTREELGNLHGKLLSHQEVLLDLTYKDSYHVSSQSTIWPSYNEVLLPECDWLEFPNDLTAQKYFDMAETFTLTSEASTPIENLAISFLTDSEESDYFWIFNKNYTGDGTDFKINFASLVNLTEIFTDEYSDCIFEKEIHLNTCEAKLFKIRRSIENNTVAGTVRIPSKFTLSIKDNELLKMAQNSELIVESGGKLNLESNSMIEASAGSKITVQSGGYLTANEAYISGSPVWNGIIAEVGSNVSLVSSRVKNAQVGLSAIGANVSVNWSSFVDCYNGVSLTNCTGYTLNNNYFKGMYSGYDSGISLTECGGSITGNTVTNFGRGVILTLSSVNLIKNKINANRLSGVYVTGYNVPQMINSSDKIELNNEVKNNGDVQVLLIYHANVYLTGGYNNIYSEPINAVPSVPCIYTAGWQLEPDDQLDSKALLPNIVRINADRNYWGYDGVISDNFDSFFGVGINTLHQGYSLVYEPYAS
jgi:hypothetical protein